MREEITRIIVGFDPRTKSLAVGRSLLASAQLMTLGLNSDSALFFRSAESSAGVRCEGIRSAGLWCLDGESGSNLVVARLLAVAVLVVVLSGLSPRWTCIPHWYVSFSLAANMSLANGGDRAGQIAAMLFVPVCLGDDRKWQWVVPCSSLPARWKGRSFAACLALRCQVSVIYLVAASSKLTDPVWRNGRALYILAYDGEFGLPVTIRHVLGSALGSTWLVAIATWGVILIEYAIGIAALFGFRCRKFALALGVCLHLAIGVLLGLASFGLTMIALLISVSYSSRSAGFMQPSEFDGGISNSGKV
ncbi:sporulation-delaying protein SdpB family protein [Amycolatopsis sp. NPDC054798]